jgi:hypothetical protein
MPYLKTLGVQVLDDDRVPRSTPVLLAVTRYVLGILGYARGRYAHRSTAEPGSGQVSARHRLVGRKVKTYEGHDQQDGHDNRHDRRKKGLPKC